MLGSLYGSPVEASVEEASINLLNKVGKVVHILGAYCSLTQTDRLPPAPASFAKESSISLLSPPMVYLITNKLRISTSADFWRSCGKRQVAQFLFLCPESWEKEKWENFSQVKPEKSTAALTPGATLSLPTKPPEVPFPCPWSFDPLSPPQSFLHSFF